MRANDIITREATNMCPYCRGTIGQIRAAKLLFDPVMPVFQAEQYTPTREGWRLDCLKCHRGYVSLDGVKFYCTDSHQRLIVIVKRE